MELPVNTEGNALERKEPELQKILIRIAGLKFSLTVDEEELQG